MYTSAIVYHVSLVTKGTWSDSIFPILVHKFDSFPNFELDELENNCQVKYVSLQKMSIISSVPFSDSSQKITKSKKMNFPPPQSNTNVLRSLSAAMVINEMSTTNSAILYIDTHSL